MLKRNLFAIACALVMVQGVAFSQENTWRLQGHLSEVCSCAPPCTCNFGGLPSPHGFCWMLFAIEIREGQYKGTDLAGLQFAMAQGGKGGVVYIDKNANSDQQAALKAIGREIYKKALVANGFTTPAKTPPDFKLLGFEQAEITHEYDAKSTKLRIGKAGKFDTKHIMGLDGKSPIVLKNNTTWAIDEAIKGKSSIFAYKDKFGNKFEFKGTNANSGEYDWNDKMKVYFK